MDAGLRRELTASFRESSEDFETMRSEGMDIKEVTAACSRTLVERSAKILHANVDKLPTDATAKCAFHKKKGGGGCPLFPHLHPETKELHAGRLIIYCCGLECTPWSSMGARRGVLEDEKFLVTLQIMQEVIVGSPDLIFIENTEHFKSSLVLRPILGEHLYDFREFVVSPHELIVRRTKSCGLKSNTDALTFMVRAQSGRWFRFGIFVLMVVNEQGIIHHS